MPREKRSPTRIAVAIGALAFFAVLAWWAQPTDDESERDGARQPGSAPRKAAEESSPGEATPQADDRGVPLPSHAKKERDRAPPFTEPTPARTENPAEREREIHRGQVNPHPQSPERDALLETRYRFEAVEGAIEAGDLETAARMLKELDSQRGDIDEHWGDRAKGYRLVLSCLEGGPSPREEEAAHHFIAEFRGSPLVRRVRRACLSGRPPRNH